jgi:hypothetical protein
MSIALLLLIPGRDSPIQEVLDSWGETMIRIFLGHLQAHTGSLAFPDLRGQVRLAVQFLAGYHRLTGPLRPGRVGQLSC